MKQIVKQLSINAIEIRPSAAKLMYALLPRLDIDTSQQFSRFIEKFSETFDKLMQFGGSAGQRIIDDEKLERVITELAVDDFQALREHCLTQTPANISQVRHGMSQGATSFKQAIQEEDQKEKTAKEAEGR